MAKIVVMSFIQVKELRKEGKLSEAYQVAQQHLAEKTAGREKNLPPILAKLFENSSDIIWAKRALAWVLYEYLKQNATKEKYDTFLKYLTELALLELPNSEQMVFDNVAWQVGKLVFDLHKQEEIDYQKIDALFDQIKTSHFTKPNSAYSFLYKAFHKGHQNWPNYLEFADWWGFQHFEGRDYLEEEIPNSSKKMMALVEQAYIAYAKKLLDGVPNGFTKQVDAVKIAAFLPLLDELIEKQPRYKYPAFFKAKLLIALGDPEDAFSAFLPFAKLKRNEFWVWSAMAEMFAHSSDKQLACYCKALSCRSSDEFLIKVRQKLATLLIKAEKFDEAKTEIIQIVHTAEIQGWNISNQVSSWLSSNWFKEASAYKNNHVLYSAHAPNAERLLFSNIPEEIGIVEFVNRDKKVLNFIVNKEKYGFLKYQGFIKDIHIGDVIKARFDGHSPEGYYHVLTLEKTNDKPDESVLKNFEGELIVPNDKPFGFVAGILIGPKMIQQYSLTDGVFIRGCAMMSFNKKKEEWGWKAVKITL